MSSLTERVRQDAPEGSPVRLAGSVTLANARLVLPDRVQPGCVRIENGVIAAVEAGTAAPAHAIDCAGALVVPGLVELHTDNLERHLKPRPGVHWPRNAAVIAHDGEIAAAGITTVFDAVRAGTLKTPFESHEGLRYAREVSVEIGRLSATGVLRADHLLHIRAEICSQSVLEEIEEFTGDPLVRIVSVMDHTPGQRQFANEAKYRAYYMGKHGLSGAEMDGFVAYTKALTADVGKKHEDGVVAWSKAAGAVLASHDDTNAGHVEASLAIGVGFAEFPTTLEAARAYHEAKVPVMMGAPNILRGGSHSGNVAAAELAAAGLLDILSSDYVPSALLMGAIKLSEITGDLPGAIATVTRNPARAAGLTDRGEIAPGQRGDLVMLADIDGMAVPVQVWRAGRQVA
ncbi:MAG: alpha-D-ribose 1-methylphosphonate 5-triphosphate diphosphatase [Pseudomonadota bacterium]